MQKEIKKITHLPTTNKGDIILVSSEPELVVEPVSSTEVPEQSDLEIKKRKLDLLNVEILHKKKLMRLEIEYAEKRNQLMDIEIALKQKQLEDL